MTPLEAAANVRAVAREMGEVVGLYQRRKVVPLSDDERQMVRRLTEWCATLLGVHDAFAPSAQTRCPAEIVDGGTFQCEGREGHEGRHWWGGMTWVTPPAEPPTCKGQIVDGGLRLCEVCGPGHVVHCKANREMRDADLRAPAPVAAVQVLRPQPGDIIVLRTEDRISPDTYARLKASAETAFPDMKVVLLDGRVSMEVVRPVTFTGEFPNGETVQFPGHLVPDDAFGQLTVAGDTPSGIVPPTLDLNRYKCHLCGHVGLADVATSAGWRCAGCQAVHRVSVRPNTGDR